MGLDVEVKKSVSVSVSVSVKVFVKVFVNGGGVAVVRIEVKVGTER
jgi:hypothetical protein